MQATEIREILENNLEGKYIKIQNRTGFMGGPDSTAVFIARNDVEINRVQNQFSECISLEIKQDGKITFQIFGCQGGRSIHRETDPSIEKEKYNALGHETMPAIRIKDPKRALIKICKDYMNITKEIEKRGLTH